MPAVYGNAHAGRFAGRPWVAAGLVALLGLVGVLVAPAAPAFAHAQLVGTSPANGARLDAAPDEVTLEFSESVNLVRDGVRLLDGSGAVRGDGPARIDPDSSTRVLVPVPAGLGTGVYTVVWRVVSSDSHPIHGAFVFGVGDVQVAAASGAGARTDVDPAVNATFWLFRWLGYAALALLLGGCAFLFLCWPEGWSQRRVRRLLYLGWLGSLLCALAVLLLQGTYSVGGSLAEVADPTRLRDMIGTTYGGYLLARVALLAACGALLLTIVRRSPGRATTAALTVLAAALPVTWVGTGHANAAPNPLVAAADALHLLAMAVWVGGLVLLFGVMLRAPSAVATGEAAHALRRFSRLAAASVVVLGVTGIYQAWRGVGTLDALAGTQYGRLLAFKLATIGIVLWFAAASRSVVQRRYVLPALDAGTKRSRTEREQHQRARQALRRSVGMEVLLAIAVLGVTSLLVATPPGARPVAETAADVGTEAAPDAALADLTFDGGIVAVRLSPPRIGATALTLAVRDPHGRPMDVPEVTARLSLGARGLGPLPVDLAKRGPGAYESTGLTLPMAGTWRLEVSVRTSEIDQYPVITDVRVR
jgi:copper transport protein